MIMDLILKRIYVQKVYEMSMYLIEYFKIQLSLNKWIYKYAREQHRMVRR